MKNLYKTEHSLVFQNDFCDWKTGELLSPIETQNYVIIQVAELYYTNSFFIKSHVQHCDLEITFPTINGLQCATDGVAEKTGKHESYVSFKGDRHELSSRYGCRFQTFAVNFKDGPCAALLTTLREKFRSTRKFYAPELAPFFTAIISEFLSTELPFSLHNLDCLITAILVKLTRCGIQAPSEQLFSSAQTLPDIINYIDGHFLEICSLDELSAKFGYTYSHICKIFKKTYGVTPSDYLSSKKMEHAAVLLAEGKTLTEIAETTGYSTPYNFSRAFKKHFGKTPNSFKKRQ